MIAPPTLGDAITPYHVFLVLATGVALVAALVDARSGHIPNALTLGPLALAPFAHAAVSAARTGSLHAALQSLGLSLVGAALCGLLPLALYRSAGMGGGDVKLFAAIGALTNAVVGLHAETYAFVFGMVGALFIVGRSGRLAATLGNVAALVGAPLRRAAGPSPRSTPTPATMTRMAFGPAIFLGTLLAAVMLWRPA